MLALLSFTPLLYIDSRFSHSTGSIQLTLDLLIGSVGSKMFSIGMSHVSLLNAAAQHYMLPTLCYLWEFGSDGTLLAGVEVAVPSMAHPGGLETIFFWDVAIRPHCIPHELVAEQALRYLQ